MPSRDLPLPAYYLRLHNRLAKQGESLEAVEDHLRDLAGLREKFITEARSQGCSAPEAERRFRKAFGSPARFLRMHGNPASSAVLGNPMLWPWMVFILALLYQAIIWQTPAVHVFEYACKMVNPRDPTIKTTSYLTPEQVVSGTGVSSL